MRKLANLVEWLLSIVAGILGTVIIVGGWVLSTFAGAFVGGGILLLILFSLITGGTKAGLEERHKESHKQPPKR